MSAEVIITIKPNGQTTGVVLLSVTLFGGAVLLFALEGAL